MWWYVYVLFNPKTKKKYIGYTNNINRRVKEHYQGRGGKYTSKFGHFKLVYYETYRDEKDARASEHFYKSGYGREVLVGKLRHFLNQ
ncbi:GIY-YIG nuclease family protein [Patescibacteria group bacterium]|nr:GIY-YIG nuclease family protein [Patescibacteria group bacterium]MBU1890288.1 GIY-YIG nuclease family protein [Patescibacteria group bacterium]